MPILHSNIGLICLILFDFVWFDYLRPINNLSGKQGRVFLGWTSTKLGQMCLAAAQGPECSDAGETRSHSPSVSSQALYHWPTVLSNIGLSHGMWKYAALALVSLHICAGSPEPNVAQKFEKYLILMCKLYTSNAYYHSTFQQLTAECMATLVD